VFSRSAPGSRNHSVHGQSPNLHRIDDEVAPVAHRCRDIARTLRSQSVPREAAELLSSAVTSAYHALERGFAPRSARTTVLSQSKRDSVRPPGALSSLAMRSETARAACEHRANTCVSSAVVSGRVPLPNMCEKGRISRLSTNTSNRRCVCWSITSDTRIAYGSRVRRQGRSRPKAWNQARSSSSTGRRLRVPAAPLARTFGGGKTRAKAAGLSSHGR
jgi:hypothetical protein